MMILTFKYLNLQKKLKKLLKVKAKMMRTAAAATHQVSNQSHHQTMKRTTTCMKAKILSKTAMILMMMTIPMAPAVLVLPQITTHSDQTIALTINLTLKKCKK